MKIVNGVKVHMLELNDAQLGVISEGLMLVPYGRAAPVIDAINRQLHSTLTEVEKTLDTGRKGGI